MTYPGPAFRVSVATPRRLAASFAVLLFIASRLFAADLEWSAVGPLLFFDAASSWNPSQSPTASDNLTFAIDVSGVPIIIGGASQGLNLDFTNNDWEFTGAAGGLLTTAGETTIDDVLATSLANGTNLRLSNNLTWNNAGNVIVGDTGFGSLLIQDGSNLRGRQIFVGNSASSVGEITLTGAGTSLTASLNSNTGVYTIGRGGGTGTINVLAGARLDTTSTAGNDIWVGGHSDDDDTSAISSTGTLNVDGVGSFVETEDLNVGIFGGVGNLNITNGGVVNTADGPSADTQFGANNGFGGLQSTGSGVVDGDGSLLQSRTIRVGASGVGTLEVRAGGRARTQVSSALAGDAFIGSSAGSDGKAAVYGSGSANSLLDVDDNLFVGDAGLGRLNIGRDLNNNEVGSGALQVDAQLLIGNAAGNNLDNRVVVSGANASANIGTNLQAGVSGHGTFEARNGATVTVGGAVVGGGLGGGHGNLLIDGQGTTLSAGNMALGNGNSGPLATGILTVSDQAVVTFTSTANGVVTLGDEAFGEGTLTVTGAGSLVQSTGGTAEWWVGGSSNDSGGTGNLNILDGGRVTTTGRLVLGYNGGAVGNVAVDGPDSRMDVNGDYILVGFNGSGNLDVTNGGVVNANRIFVADAIGSAGSQLNVDGVGSVVNIDGLLHVGDSARGIVNVTGGAQLNVATDNLADRLIIGDESPTDASRLTVSGAGSRVDYFGTDRVSVGFVGGGSFNDPVILEVLNGGVMQTEHAGVNTSIGIYVADEPSSAGLVTVDGNGSRLQTRLMNVSDSTGTRGTVNITGGGRIDVDEFVEIGSAGDGDGFLTVSGAGSRLDVGGDLSAASGASNLRVDGTITISDGGMITNGDQGFIGRATTNVGLVTVGGVGALATWDVGTDLFIAGNESLAINGSQISGSGTLHVLANGQVTVGNTLVLKDRGTITLDGGEVAANNFLFQDFDDSLRPGKPTVNFNSGTFRYTAGKTLAAGDLDRIFNGGPQVLTAGKRLAIDGTAVVSGPAQVGNTPLRINGGTLSVGAISPSSMANIDFDAGTLELTDSDLTIGSGGLFGTALVLDSQQTVQVTGIGRTTNIAAGGSLNVIGGGFRSPSVTNDGIVIVSQTSDVDFDSDNLGNGLVNNGRLVLVDANLNGIVSGSGAFQVVGTSGVGELSMSPPSRIEFLLSGTGVGEFDSLHVDGAATLGGSLVVGLANGFMPMAGDSFELLTASAGLTGTFDSLVLPSLTGGLSWNLNYDAESAVLRVSGGSLPGDFDADGMVNAMDINRLYDEIFAQTNGAGFDLTGDGFVNNDDIAAWLDVAGTVNGTTYFVGDADLDGIVGGSDFTTVASNFGIADLNPANGAYWGNGNFDGRDANGFFSISGSDFTAIASNFGQTSLSAVPEPTGLWFGWLVMMWLVTPMRRNARRQASPRCELI